VESEVAGEVIEVLFVVLPVLADVAHDQTTAEWLLEFGNLHIFRE
jgi:hypothetical protein